MAPIYRNSLKRPLDVALSIPLVILTSPLLLVAAGIIKLDSRGPILFTQSRVGLAGKAFQIMKLRTMTVEARDLGKQVDLTTPGVTAAGRWLRRFKIDELPQLLNVIRGEMSLVGPRPDLPANVAAYPAFAKARLGVRPGMTGLAQVSGNTALSWEERWELDVSYVRLLSFRLDLTILLRTLRVLAIGEGRDNGTAPKRT
jgi:lipopolysaccharide/colanic/teichoic acid biosynthesis glycosyltransferase